MGAGMLDDVFAERIMIFIAGSFGGLGRLETHVVPAEILEAVSALGKTLRAHGRASGTLAGEQAGGERSERLCFGGHLLCPLTDQRRGGRSPRPDADSRQRRQAPNRGPRRR